jgi:hypothetical protein
MGILPISIYLIKRLPTTFAHGPKFYQLADSFARRRSQSVGDFTMVGDEMAQAQRLSQLY